MAEIRIYVDESRAVMRKACDLTAGMLGVKVVFEFSPDWNDLIRTAVFRTDDVTKDVLIRNGSAEIPGEVLMGAGKKLYIGAYGVSKDGEVAIPTRWACADRIYSGANPSGDTTTDKTLPFWAQIQTQIGDLDELQTAEKESLVAAINTLIGNGEVSEDAIRAAVNEYLKDHNIATNVTGAVSYERSQSLTASQKDQARSNIGAVSRDEVELKEADYIRAGAEAVAEKILSITGEVTSAGTSGGYVNQLPVSIDADGSIYNGTGYKTGTRLNSSGSVKEITESYFDANVGTTGFIPCKMGDTIRLQGMVIDPADEQAGTYNIHVYDSGFGVVGSSAWLHIASHASVVVDSNGYVTEITLAEGTVLGAANAAYLRLSARGISGESIITVNQEISGGAAEVSNSAVPFTMAFLTDLHWRDLDQKRYEAAAHALRIVEETAPLDLVCFAGDYTYNWTEESAEDARSDISNCRKTFADVKTPALWLRGNHENNGYLGQRLSRQEIFNRVSRGHHTLPGYITNPEDPYGCYGYLDFENVKLRVLVVNTSDNDQMGAKVTAAGNAADLINCHNIGAVQLQWIADHALDLSDKKEPGAWMILVLSHIPIYSENSWYNSHGYTDGDGKTWTCNVVNLQTLMTAYRNQGSFAVTHNGETAEKDFAGKKPAGKILFVNGHGHCLKQIANQGLSYVTCPNTCNNGESESADGVTYKKRKVGMLEETSVTFLTVDAANRKAYAWIYGAGYDREIDF